VRERDYSVAARDYLMSSRPVRESLSSRQAPIGCSRQEGRRHEKIDHRCRHFCAPKPLKAGERYQVPSGAIHDARNGAGGAKVLAVHIMRKGEPLAQPI